MNRECLFSAPDNRSAKGQELKNIRLKANRMKYSSNTECDQTAGLTLNFLEHYK